jgi:hypothetical protein
VSALAVSGSDLYAGGLFTTAGGSAANYIAKWNGSRWMALGSGMNYQGYVSALAVSGSDLYAGGYFTTAGGKVSAYVARAIVNPPVLAIEGDGDGGYLIRFSGVPGSRPTGCSARPRPERSLDGQLSADRRRLWPP